METKTAFDLIQAIASWKSNLAESAAFLPENIEELETHLRDSISMLECRGLSVEEAFIVAIRRIGGGSSLAKEFGEVNRKFVWLDRGLWMVIGIQLWIWVYGFCGSVARSMVFFALKQGHMLQADTSKMALAILALFQVFCFIGICLLCLRFIAGRSETLLCWSRRLFAGRKKSIAVFGAGLVSILLTGIHYLMSGLYMKTLAVDEIGRFAFFQQFYALLLVVVQPAALVTLAVCFARKRFKLSNG